MNIQMGEFIMFISKDSSAPIHQQLGEMIMEKIRKGILKPGDRVGSEFGIANKYRISRSTVRNVFDRLVAKNVLLRRAGKGTFVAFPVTTENVSLLVGFSEKMKEIGCSVKTKVIKVEVKPIYNNLQEKMKLKQDDKIIEINRIRFINEIPFVVHYAFLPFEKCKSIIDVDLEKVSLTSSLQNILGIHLSHTEETIYAYQSELEEAKLLEIKKDSPILVVKGLTYYGNGIPIRYSIAKYRYDVVRLKTTHKK